MKCKTYRLVLENQLICRSNFSIEEVLSEPIVIIGAGLAGLAAAIRLAELGEKAVVLEAGHGPSQRVCGAFFSPECLPIFSRWGVVPSVTIPHARFIHKQETVEFAFPQAAGGLSRLKCESLVAEHAQRCGVDIHWGAQVKAIKPLPNNRYNVELSSGECINTNRLLIASGRWSKWLSPDTQTTKPPRGYIGIKAQFAGIPTEDWIEMHIMPGAYAGLTGVENGETNVACLATALCYDSLGGTPDSFWNGLLQTPSAARLKKRMEQTSMTFPKWMSAEVPAFGIRSQPGLPNIYLVGDAAGSIPPISGDGMAMAIGSGCMAAEYAQKGKDEAFRNDWQKRFGPRIRRTLFLHECALRPWTAAIVNRLAHWFPSLPPMLFSITRER
jgi:flavin-dependent dehydrogenase